MKKKNSYLIIPNADKRLKELCDQGMKKLFGTRPPQAVKDRLEHELKIVKRNGHASIYLLACLLSQEAERLHHVIFFRGVITSSLIAYTGGFSKVNPMEPEYGGVYLPFETTREEFEKREPELEIQCGAAFIFYAQAFLCRELPEYRYIAYPRKGNAGIQTIRLYFVKLEDVPAEELLDQPNSNLDEYPDYMYFDDFYHITLMGDNKMEPVRYNTFYRDKVSSFDESNSKDVIPKLWRYVKKNDSSLRELKDLMKYKVRTYEELLTALCIAHSTSVWEGMAREMVMDGRLPLSEMPGSRDDVLCYLLGLGYEREEAYRVWMKIWRGRHLTSDEINTMRERGADDWFLDLCEHVRYMFPRAHCAQMIRRDAFLLDEPDNQEK